MYIYLNYVIYLVKLRKFSKNYKNCFIYYVKWSYHIFSCEWWIFRLNVCYIGSGGADSLINVGSDDETPIIDFGRQTEHRRLLDHYNSIVHASQSSRYSRSGRRSRRISDHPYFTRSELDNNPSNSRTSNHRRVRFSSTNQSLNDVSTKFFYILSSIEYLLKVAL